MGIIASNSCDHSKSEEPLGLKLLMKVFLSTTKLLWSVFDLRIAGHTLIIVQYASFKYKNKFSGKNLVSQSVPELILTDKFKFSRYLYSDQSVSSAQLPSWSHFHQNCTSSTVCAASY